MNTPPLFAERISNIPESFIREILKVSTQKNMISFAGGLPNPDFFPCEKMAEAAEKVFQQHGKTALQYAPTEGFLPLRQFLAERISKIEGMTVRAEDVLMLNGSQQGLDLSGKLFIDRKTDVLLEEPSYLGAIQAFSAYEPTFHSVKLQDDGPDINDFINKTKKFKPKFFYCIPNFQNPTGTTYSENRRIAMVESQADSSMLWIEDNPYGEIFFNDGNRPDFHALMPDKTIMLGSFSKIISPGMRLGWATGPTEIIRKMTVAKQASDLHSNNLSQRIVYQFLLDNSLDDHLQRIRTFYKSRAEKMVQLMKDHFPVSARWVKPEGGMFIWVRLEEKVNAMDVLKKCVQQNVLIVPGENFYTDPANGKNTLRLNFSNPSDAEMEQGIEIVGSILKEFCR